MELKDTAFAEKNLKFMYMNNRQDINENFIIKDLNIFQNFCISIFH